MPAVAIGEVAVTLAKRLEATQPETEWQREWQLSGFVVTKRRFEMAELHIVEFTETPRGSEQDSTERATR